MEEKKKPCIAVSGKSGCGNTTVSGLLAEKLGVPLVNFTFHNLAVERNMPFEKVLEAAKKDDSWDREVDTRQVKMALENRDAGLGCVLGSRLAIWMLKEADLKVYLRAKAETRAKRVQKREGGNLDDIAAFTAKRDKEDRERYIKLYGIDNDCYDQAAGLVIDVDEISPEEIVAAIMQKI
jgi:cytidylate kinase